MDQPLGRHLPLLVEETEDEEMLVCCWTDEEDGSWWRIDVVGGVAVTYCYCSWLPGLDR